MYKIMRYTDTMRCVYDVLLLPTTMYIYITWLIV